MLDESQKSIRGVLEFEKKNRPSSAGTPKNTLSCFSKSSSHPRERSFIFFHFHPL